MQRAIFRQLMIGAFCAGDGGSGERRRERWRQAPLADSVITIECTCGETFQADDAHVGKTIRCRCGHLLKIVAPVPSSAPRPLHPRTRASPYSDPATTTATPHRSWTVLGVALSILGTALAIVLLLVVASSLLRQDIPNQTSRTTTPPPVLPSQPLAPPCDSVKQPRSSTPLGGSYRRGLGRLRVMNGTDFDAVAVLLESSTNLRRRAIYIRRNESGSITQILAGAYWLQFQLGTSWHVNRHFCRMAGSFEFDDPFDFEEREKSDGIEYSTFKITLHPVPLGTATTHSIPASAFELPPL